MSDIFGALFDSFMGKGDTDTWLVGEDAFTPNLPGDALRFMCDPEKDKTPTSGDFYSRDYYPDRYRGPADNGGVHFNSGIANLGKCVETHTNVSCDRISTNALYF